MSHPDAAWSPFEYVGPAGLEIEPCRHSSRRMRVGPTGRRATSILADSCGLCGRVVRTVRDVSWQEYIWLRRWNARVNCQACVITLPSGEFSKSTYYPRLVDKSIPVG